MDRPDNFDYPFGRVAKGEYHSEARVRLVAIGIRNETRIVLLHPGEVAEPGGSIVSGTCVDTSQVHSHGATVPLGCTYGTLATLSNCE